MELASSRQRKLQLSVVDGVISALAGNQWCCGKSRVPGGPGKLIRSPLSGRLVLPRQPWRSRCTTMHTTQPILGPPGASKTGNPRDTSNVNSTPPPTTGFIASQLLIDLVNINSLVDSPLDEHRKIPWLIKLLLDCKSIQSLAVTNRCTYFPPLFSHTARHSTRIDPQIDGTTTRKIRHSSTTRSRATYHELANHDPFPAHGHERYRHGGVVPPGC